jgi:hypothetical protein
VDSPLHPRRHRCRWLTWDRLHPLLWTSIWRHHRRLRPLQRQLLVVRHLHRRPWSSGPSLPVVGSLLALLMPREAASSSPAITQVGWPHLPPPIGGPNGPRPGRHVGRLGGGGGERRGKPGASALCGAQPVLSWRGRSPSGRARGSEWVVWPPWRRSARLPDQATNGGTRRGPPAALGAAPVERPAPGSRARQGSRRGPPAALGAAPVERPAPGSRARLALGAGEGDGSARARLAPGAAHLGTAPRRGEPRRLRPPAALGAGSGDGPGAGAAKPSARAARELQERPGRARRGPAGAQRGRPRRR